MGFLKKIGHRTQKGRKIASTVAHGASIELRKVGHTLSRVGNVGTKIGNVLEMIPDPRAKALGTLISTGSSLASSAGNFSGKLSSGIEHARKGKIKSAMVDVSDARRQARERKRI